ncbi:uncharacterized protein B0H64DRAFT_397861 [Chaetomium fimeti]|uniref:Uncharacterized protein n=1 Tax=Chaetomium fimeti TaxID=1854472 RepID=A0AAE0HH12_9PEZI|nr:hypothetical protein B0H64DRAFT_397861 [Chaetomium fimeti]
MVSEAGSLLSLGAPSCTDAARSPFGTWMATRRRGRAKGMWAGNSALGSLASPSRGHPGPWDCSSAAQHLIRHGASKGTPSRATWDPPPLANLDSFGTSDHVPLSSRQHPQISTQREWNRPWQLRTRPNAAASAPGDTAVVLIAVRRYGDGTF